MGRNNSRPRRPQKRTASLWAAAREIAEELRRRPVAEIAAEHHVSVALVYRVARAGGWRPQQ